MNRYIKQIQNYILNLGILVFLFFAFSTASAQSYDLDLKYHQWQANWISVPGTDPNSYGVYYFRKKFEITAIPETFPVHVSADNRYKLFVNEKLVSIGPTRGDIQHWNFETVDISPFLHEGANIIAAQVWNEGELRTEGHISLRSAFILQGTTVESEILNSNKTWKCYHDKGYRAIPTRMKAYYVGGPGEALDFNRHPKKWKELTFEDKHWMSAQVLFPGLPKNVIGRNGITDSWLLVPSTIPPMELKQQRLLKVRKVDGISVPHSFLEGRSPVTIPANSYVSLLLDQDFLTNAYPTVKFSGGKDAIISIKYQESLFSQYPEKGNRNEIDGKTMIGRLDSILCDGSEAQVFTSLNWRTYRYIQLDITTKKTPLVIEDFFGTFTGYPFQLNGSIETDNAELKKIFEMGWHTARLCAMDTYMDCPYYEQLQYIGDTRIQGLVSIYNSGDDRLLRNAINLIFHSQQPEGITSSRHPSVTPQYITPFSLWYISMLHDYMMYGKDMVFIKEKLPSARQVLSYFERFQEKDGSLKDVAYWNFTDWVNSEGWIGGVAPKGADGNSSILDMQLLWAYQVAAEMEEYLGIKELANEYTQKVEQLKKTIHFKYWDEKRKLFADRSERDMFSQHTNTLAILTGMVNNSEAWQIGEQLLVDTTLAPASIYFKYYLHQALTKAGFGDDYLNWLDKWQENIKMGLTTWAEISDINISRSDCHAWGCSPNIEFFRIVLGIDSYAPGFSKIRIEPHLGVLQEIGGEMPHPNGVIKVNYKINSGQLHALIIFPQGISGVFVWKGNSYELTEGVNTIKI